ncbi:MAG: right-handed parallel beta-helix repeat-containing protein [Pacificimonas sp.]|jgi:parallel beta-helix repeat protein|nr:right-handed parallel beta-helix repeat-containing protein [Pacificimonas sp.]
MAGKKRSFEERQAQLRRVQAEFEERKGGRPGKARRARSASGKRRRWPLIFTGLLAAALIAAIGYAALSAQQRYGRPVTDLFGDWFAVEGDWQAGQRPTIAPVIRAVQAVFPRSDLNEFTSRTPGAPVTVAGPSLEIASAPLCFQRNGRPIPTTAAPDPGVSVDCSYGRSATIPVASEQGLVAAFQRAAPGDVIEIAPGDYKLGGTVFDARRDGNPQQPIIVRAAVPGSVTLNTQALETFRLTKQYWVVENLDFVGQCGAAGCEHAIHISGPAENNVIRNNSFRNYNAALKVNRVARIDRQPDGLLIEANSFRNDAPHPTSTPVTPIDVVATDDVVIRGNLVADFGKSASDRVSYGLFVKGGSENPVIERNHVRCADSHSGGTRIGVSLGGGGTGMFLCKSPNCQQETIAGTIRGNIIEQCSDVGIYLNKATASIIANNTLVDTRGIDARFDTTDALILNNVIDGRVAERDGGQVSMAGNETSGLSAALLRRHSDGLIANADGGDYRWADSAFAAQRGVPLPPRMANFRDYCGTAVDLASPPVGAIEQANGEACARRP